MGAFPSVREARRLVESGKQRTKERKKKQPEKKK